MANITATSDSGLLDLLRQKGPQGITALATATKVTPTAVRQRLSRLMGQGLVERQTTRAGRGRPSHRYSITPQGQRSAGNNFSDLAVVLWQEIRTVQDVDVRRGLFKRLATKMAGLYERQIHGTTAEERMRSVAEVFSQRDVPLVVEFGGGAAAGAAASTSHAIQCEDSEAAKTTKSPGSLPILTALACPYPDLAEQDRGICAVERMMFSELVGHDVRLAECRLDGDQCCRFAMT